MSLFLLYSFNLLAKIFFLRFHHSTLYQPNNFKATFFCFIQPHDFLISELWDLIFRL